MAAAATPNTTAIRTALATVDAEFRCHGSRLPDGLCHLNRSVREAATNYAGGAVSPLDPRSARLTGDNHHEFYWQIAVEYIEQAQRAVARWRDHPAGRHELVPYHRYRADEDRYLWPTA